MNAASKTTPVLRELRVSDLWNCLALGAKDFRAAPVAGLILASIFVLAGASIAAITYWTGQTFWLVLAVLGFPMIGSLASVGFYEMSRQLRLGTTPHVKDVLKFVWACRHGQIPWLAAIIVVVFLFWFFLGHMIFALFLGLTPMTNISTSLDVFTSPQGMMMLAVGTAVGAVFSALVFSLSVHGLPLLIDKDIDFVTAMILSLSAVAKSLPTYFLWACIFVTILFLSILPFFAGLFVTLPILGHATWHLYERLEL